MIYCVKAEFGQIFRSFSLNGGAIRLKRPKNLTQIGFPSLRSVKSDRLLACTIHKFADFIPGFSGFFDFRVKNMPDVHHMRPTLNHCL
jgi:hypothetical protein